MAHWMFQVSLADSDALPKDRYVNTFHFNVDGVGALAVLQQLKDFYTVDSTANPYGAGKISDYLSNRLSLSGHTIKAYDMSQAPPRVPMLIEPFTLPNRGPDCLPTEVAACLSYHGAVQSGVSQARRRGRIFIGPLTRNAVNEANGLLKGAFTAILRKAAHDLLARNSTWSVYSKIGNALIPVVGGWVDNAVDIQRRRGTAPLARETWDVNQ